MLQKIYLFSTEQFQKCACVKNKIITKKKSPSEHDNDNWIKMSKTIREEDVTRNAQTKDIAKFLKLVLPDRPLPALFPKIESRYRTPL